MSHLFTQIVPMFTGLPGYFKENHYLNPTDASDGPWQYGLSTNQTFFEYLKTRNSLGQHFNNLMALNHDQTARSWVKTYPIEVLAQAYKAAGLEGSSIPLLVDVGGGIGRDLQNLERALAPAKYPLVLQDLPHVVAQAKDLPASIAVTAHDFFTTQPVKGAAAYFLHSCLHDWPDSQAIKILKLLVPAMTPHFSKLLLCESVLPEHTRLPLKGALDFVMMGLLSARERTNSDWRALLESAGYQNIKFIGSEDLQQCVIEADIAALEETTSLE